ncbi:MAG: D-alanyl-D-alanine carboxypeptidase [Ruminococcus sp.]|nr:D-alanyl-D-alanine carboxypeptidase [Ruminococcus sp.]MDY3895772.1 D-alanyl-D-alanine carboxypeptidase family protein [Candidatus Fimenecus sp.]
MKRAVSVMTATVIFMLIFSIGAFAANTPAEDFPPMQVEINAKAALLMEAETGKVLMASNPNEKLPPASVTKIMSLLLVAEAIDDGKISLTDEVTASTEASKMGGSQIWLKENEVMTVDDLLKATTVYSANDACTALSEYVGGSTSAFVRMMNERAKELGMNDTNFENCTGLDDTVTQHYTSCYDIALMSRELLKHKIITNYTTIWMDSLRGGKTQLVNTNKLIRFYNGATGLKTGTTDKAGCCVSATAERDGMSLIAVVLGSDNSKNRFSAARAMLDWGFANYSKVTVSVTDDEIMGVRVLGGTADYVTPLPPKEISMILKKGDESKLTKTVTLSEDVSAPVEKGQRLGSVVVSLDGEKQCEIPLTSPEKVERLSLKDVILRLFSALNQPC